MQDRKLLTKKTYRIIQLLQALGLLPESAHCAVAQLSKQIVTSLTTSDLGQEIARHVKWGGNKASSTVETLLHKRQIETTVW